MFDTAHLSSQQVVILCGIATFAVGFPVLLTMAALAGHLRNRSIVRAAIRDLGITPRPVAKIAA